MKASHPLCRTVDRIPYTKFGVYVTLLIQDKPKFNGPRSDAAWPAPPRVTKLTVRASCREVREPSAPKRDAANLRVWKLASAVEARRALQRATRVLTEVCGQPRTRTAPVGKRGVWTSVIWTTDIFERRGYTIAPRGYIARIVQRAVYAVPSDNSSDTTSDTNDTSTAVLWRKSDLHRSKPSRKRSRVCRVAVSNDNAFPKQQTECRDTREATPAKCAAPPAVYPFVVPRTCNRNSTRVKKTSFDFGNPQRVTIE